MKFYEINLVDRQYQKITLPQGSAPVGFLKADDGYKMVYIGESILETAPTDCGVYIIKTGQSIPDEVHIMPFLHPLTNQPVQPNARYIGTVEDTHLVLGNPKSSILG